MQQKNLKPDVNAKAYIEDLHIELEKQASDEKNLKNV